MPTVHLYLQPGKSELRIVRRTFSGPGKCATARERVPFYGAGTPGAEIKAWLAAQQENPEVRGVWNCAGTGVKKPDTWRVAWHDLPAGSAVEKL